MKKTIDEQANDYANQDRETRSEHTAFSAGAEWMYSKLTAESKALRAALKEAMEWLSIGDELPEVGKYFLGLLSDEFATPYAIYQRKSASDKGYIAALLLDGVTHWRPIESEKAKELLKLMEDEK